MSTENKDRLALRMGPGTKRKIEQWYKAAGCRSKNQFVERAVNFCVDHLAWEGKFSPKWPDGKKHSRSVYAQTQEKCEEKLAELIQQMKAEIAEARRLVSEGNWEEAMALAGQKKARGARKAV